MVSSILFVQYTNKRQVTGNEQKMLGQDGVARTAVGMYLHLHLLLFCV